ncbi:MAG: ferritin-like domain-containing protein [Polyangiaceae bacterium]|nr:ferritin-like domain-containing protein [Polyangiaceae bacterium]
MTGAAGFSVEWLGDLAGRVVRRRRAGIGELGWGTIDRRRYSDRLLAQAQRSWTESAISEYATAISFGRLVGLLLEARAPIDLSGMFADFILDEIVHVEMSARMAMELGGAAPMELDPKTLGVHLGADIDPALGAAEIALRVSCVGEAFSLPMLRAMAKAARHPLPRALFARIAREEAPHARAGALVVGWYLERAGAAGVEHLRAAAIDEIRTLSAYWAGLRSGSDGMSAAGHPVEHVLELGWLEASDYAVLARRVTAERVVRPLADMGIPVGLDDVREVLAA